MPKLNLTDLAIQNLKPPLKGQADYWDTTVPLFGVRVSQGGTKAFIVLLNGRRKGIGKHPTMTLKKARLEAMRILSNPASQAKSEHLEVSYPEAVERYLNMKQGEVAPRTLEGYAHLLNIFEFPQLVSDIRPHHVGDALDRIEQQTKKTNAYTVLKMFFNWCLAREYCQSNPLQNLKKPKVPAARERVLSDDELVAIWNACNQLGKYGAIVQVLMLTGQRREQIAQLQTKWEENKAIVFPGAVMKSGKEHYCPTGNLTRYVLLQTIPLDGYYFSPLRAVGRPFSAWSKSKRLLDSMIDIDPWRLHDLRRTWATNAARLDIPPHITARILNHTSEEGKVAKIYNRHKYKKEMAAAMDKMNDHILSLISGDPT